MESAPSWIPICKTKLPSTRKSWCWCTVGWDNPKSKNTSNSASIIVLGDKFVPVPSQRGQKLRQPTNSRWSRTNKHSSKSERSLKSKTLRTNVIARCDSQGPSSSRCVRWHYSAFDCCDPLIFVLTVQGAPPLHHRFDSDYVPAHVTYAFKENVEIFRNDNYYHWPGKTKRADVLFLNMNAPAKMDSMPTDGSEIFVGVASVAYHAMTELAQKFPAFFKNKKSPSRFKGNSQSPLSP